MPNATTSSNADVWEIAKLLPKTQLHLHLDGSIPETTIQTLANAHSIQLPAPPERLREHFLSLKFRQQAANSYVQKPAGNWQPFNFINSLLRTPTDLRTATTAIVHELKLHNVVLAEIRFCPTLYPFPAEHAVEAVVEAFRNTGIKGGVILCALRSYPPQHVEHIVTLAKHYRSTGVIGIDLAGDEGTYPLSIHKQALVDAVRQGINVTVHAGEWGPKATENLLEALSIPAKRVGHALALRQENLRKLMGHVFVETCLTANCSGGQKVPTDQFQLHPINQMLEAGVRVAAFNCDNVFLSGTINNRPDPTAEIVRARLGCGLTWRQIETVLVDGVRASFDDSVFEDEGTGSFLDTFQKEIREVLGDVIEE